MLDPNQQIDELHGMIATDPVGEPAMPNIRSRFENQPAENIEMELSPLEADIVDLIQNSSPFCQVTIEKHHGVIIRVEIKNSFVTRDGRLNVEARKDINKL